MTKKNKTPFGIFTESVGLYFSNFKNFVKFMSFPVWGQVIGLGIVFLCTYFYSKNLPFLIEKYAAFNNFHVLVLMSALVALPGMVIFTKAFWEYLVAYGAVNSMLDNMLKSGRVYDFSAHTELIKRRTGSFIGLWLLFGIFSLIAAIPFFWVPAAVLMVYFILIFQVFTFEPDLSPIGCFKKSFNLIKGHFGSTFILMALVGILTWIFIPQITNNIFDIAGINKFFSQLIMPFTEIIPLDELNTFLSQLQIPDIKGEDITMFVVTSTVAQIMIQYTLPLRSILFGMWYKELNDNTQPKAEKTKRKSSKRPSEKLMEESHKKYSGKSKKLDRNILRRAMEKDEPEDEE